LLLYLLHRLLPLFFPARLRCLLYLLLEFCPHWSHVLLHLLPHGLRDLLVELCQDGSEGLCNVRLKSLT